MNNNTGYQDSADFTRTNNINGIETEHKTYNDSGSISWNVGEYTPTGDSEVGAQIYMPDHIDENTQIVVYYKGMDDDYSSRNCVSLNELNCNNNTILIFPRGSYYYSGKEAANTLNSLSDIIPGDWDNITVAGVSAGGGSAFALARNYSVAEDGTYKYHISTLSLGDSYHPERSMYYIPNSDDDYLAMINKGMKLVGVTSDGDNGNPDAVRVFKHWASLGGETFYIDYAVSHDGKCKTPYYNNYLNWILGKGDLTDDFKEKLNHFYIFVEDPETGEWKKKDLSYEEATKYFDDMVKTPMFELSDIDQLYNRLKDDNALYNLNIRLSQERINKMLSEFLSTDAGFLVDKIQALTSKINGTKIKDIKATTDYASTTNSPKMQDVKIMEYIAKTSELLAKTLECVEFAMHAQLEIEATENEVDKDAADLSPSGSVTAAALAGAIAGLGAAADALGYTGTKKQEYIDAETAKLYEKYYGNEANKEAENKGLSGEEKDKFVDDYINDRIKEFEKNKDKYDVDVETDVNETDLKGNEVKAKEEKADMENMSSVVNKDKNDNTSNKSNASSTVNKNAKFDDEKKPGVDDKGNSNVKPGDSKEKTELNNNSKDKRENSNSSTNQNNNNSNKSNASSTVNKDRTGDGTNTSKGNSEPTGTNNGNSQNNSWNSNGTGNVSNSNNNAGSNGSGSGSSYGNGGYSPSTPSTPSTPSNNDVISSGALTPSNDTVEFPEYSSVVSDNNTDVYSSLDSSYKIIVNHDNNAVTSVEHYFDFGNSDKALSSLGKITQGYTGNMIESIKCEGQYVKVIFKDSYYNTSSYNDFISKFDGFNKITK